MFQRGTKFYADYRDTLGQRHRKAFTSEVLALEFERARRCNQPSSGSTAPTAQNGRRRKPRRLPAPMAHVRSAQAPQSSAVYPRRLQADAARRNPRRANPRSAKHDDRPTAQANTRRGHIHALRTCVRALVVAGADRRLEKCLPLTARPAPRSTVAAAGELDRLIAVARPWEQLLLLLVHDQALRARAALELSSSDFQPQTKTITSRGKRNQVTRIPASGRVAQMLHDCPPGDGSYISRYAGRTITYPVALQHWYALRAKAGVNQTLNMHDLRRTMAEDTYRICGDLRVIQTLLGHNLLHSTTVYLQRPASEATFEAIRNAQEATIETAPARTK